MAPGETPIPAELLPPDLFVIDLIYNPPLTQLLKDATAARDTILGGELMLLQQGAKAFELWTGKPAPIEVMQAELDRAREQGVRPLPIDMGPAAAPGVADTTGGAAAGRSARGRPSDGPSPIPDHRRVAWTCPVGHDRRNSRRAGPHRRMR